jgi:hypothetical protein
LTRIFEHARLDMPLKGGYDLSRGGPCPAFRTALAAVIVGRAMAIRCIGVLHMERVDQADLSCGSNMQVERL